MAACDSSVGEAVDVALGFPGGVTTGGSLGNTVTVGVGSLGNTGTAAAEAASDAFAVEGGAESSATPRALAIRMALARLLAAVTASENKPR